MLNLMASLGSCGAFGAKNLTSVVIPNTIKVIEENAFEYNDLGNVTFQDSSKLETIKSSSFTGNNIQSVTIPDSVTYLDCLAFDSNVNINKKSDLSCSLTPTDASCFYTTLIDNNGKEEVVIMGYDNSCGTNVVIPSEIDGNPVTVIGNSCTGIGAYPAANKSFNNAYLNDLIYKNSRFNVDTIEISNCGAFLFKDLINVVIPDTVRLIEDEAFMYNQLTNITIPNSVVEIGQNAFGYNGLTSVRFEENSKLETISLNAFTDNQLTSVTIPDSVTYLSCQAFDSDVTVNKKETLTCVSDGK